VPTALPGVDGGTWLNPAPSPVTSAPSAGAADRNGQQNKNGGLDTWLLDKLFGRH